MFSHYFKISTRMLLRHKLYYAINILGLAVGMGVCLLIYQYIHFELSYDRFHDNAENIYRLTQTTIRNGENQGTAVYTTRALGPTGKESIPETKDFVRVRPDDVGLIVINPKNDEKHQENGIWYTDDNFLQIFNFPLQFGNPATALNGMNNIVLTQSMATKYFGDADPIGEVLKISAGTLSGDFIVTGVLEELPMNSHLQFDFLLPMAFLLEHWRLYKDQDNGWEWNDFVTYVAFDKNADLDEVSEKYDQLVASHTGEEVAKSNAALKIGFQPLTDIHLKSDFPKDLTSNQGDIQNIQFFTIIALFILLMAWINYINLSTARAMHRAKEVGVRKSIGALKRQLVSQFMVESFLVNCLAALLSVGVAFLSLPVLNNIIGKELTFDILQQPEFWMGSITIIIFGSILAGLYPAFVLSSFNPVSVLKSATVASKKGFSLRKGLIVFQFLTSVLLISGTYLVYQQITFMKNQDLGFDMEKILVVNGPRVILETLIPEGKTIGTTYQTFKSKAFSDHSILAVSATSQIPAKGYTGTFNVRKLGEPENTTKEVNAIFVDTDFTSAYNIEFLAKKKFPDQIAPYQWLIINEEAVKAFELGSPEKALNEQLVVFGDTLNILGVVKNMHWSSLRDAHSPLLFTLDNYYGAYFSIKMTMTNIQESIAHIKSAYHAVYPDDPFYYFFLDDDFNRQYQADLQFGNLFSAFSILAIFIACLGLFALVSFSATLRIKEIGIRKVLGAGVGHLMALLSREYLVLLCIAIALAVPVIILGGRAWLENYAYQVGIGLDLFLVPALILTIIALMTVSYRTYAAARANPVDSLKTE